MKTSKNYGIAGPTFEVHCNAGDAGGLRAKTNSVSVRIGQRVRRNGATETWDSVIILCEETQQGTLSTRVIVCHPDWEQQLQIAHIQSRVMEPNTSIPTLELDLKPAHI
jgi:hypothetical protein